MSQTIILIVGIIAITLSLILFALSFFQKSQDYNAISSDSLRLISGLQLLGGFLSITGSQTQALIPAYAYIIVGISLIIMSCVMLAGLRTPRPKRKSKPKN